MLEYVYKNVVVDVSNGLKAKTVLLTFISLNFHQFFFFCENIFAAQNGGTKFNVSEALILVSTNEYKYALFQGEININNGPTA